MVTYISLHVLHVETILALLALLVLLLLAAALLYDAETAGDDEQARYHGDGDEGPGRHCGTHKVRRSCLRSGVTCQV